MIARFIEKVEADPTTGCLNWTAVKDSSGYGSFKWKTKKSVGAHRAAYELFVGPIPEGLHIDHLCRNPLCVNPAHLELVTPAENTRRGWPATKTHCVHGHEYTVDNTYLRPRGSGGRRDCRACIRERAARYQARKRLAA